VVEVEAPAAVGEGAVPAATSELAVGQTGILMKVRKDRTGDAKEVRNGRQRQEG
jgi:hypothetical protein